MNDLLKINHFRFFLSLCAALCISIIVNHYIAKTAYYLMPLTTLYVMQTSAGNALYQGIQRLILVVLLIATAALLLTSLEFFYDTAHDALMGAIIGITANSLLLPRRVDNAFREKIFPVLQTFNTYFSAIIDELFEQEKNHANNAALENALLQLPGWVYKRGFDSFLQTGYRFFLIKLEQISDVLFSLQHLARHQYDRELLAKIRLPLLAYAENVNQFFSSLATVMELKPLTEEPSDLANEIAELQKQFFAIVPNSLELIDLRRDYVCLAAFIYNLKDLRNLLFKMGEALR